MWKAIVHFEYKWVVLSRWWRTHRWVRRSCGARRMDDGTRRWLTRGLFIQILWGLSSFLKKCMVIFHTCFHSKITCIAIVLSTTFSKSKASIIPGSTPHFLPTACKRSRTFNLKVGKWKVDLNELRGYVFPPNHIFVWAAFFIFFPQ